MANKRVVLKSADDGKEIEGIEVHALSLAIDACEPVNEHDKGTMPDPKSVYNSVIGYKVELLVTNEFGMSYNVEARIVALSIVATPEGIELHGPLHDGNDVLDMPAKREDGH